MIAEMYAANYKQVHACKGLALSMRAAAVERAALAYEDKDAGIKMHKTYCSVSSYWQIFIWWG